MKQISYQTILVTTDGSPLAASALPHALFLAKHLNTKIIVFGVIESAGQELTAIQPTDLSPPASRIGPTVVEITSRMRKVVEDHVRKVKRDLERGGAEQIEMRISEGVPEREIVAVAKKEKVDLIIMATHGRSGLGRAVLGSVTDYVVRHASCPVLVVHPQKR